VERGTACGTGLRNNIYFTSGTARGMAVLGVDKN
jgi:hypothetical protein